MTMSNNILQLVIEARSEHNDGWTKKLCRKRLEGIKDPEVKKTIESILGRENESCEYRI